MTKWRPGVVERGVQGLNPIELFAIFALALAVAIVGTLFLPVAALCGLGVVAIDMMRCRLGYARD